MTSGQLTPKQKYRLFPATAHVSSHEVHSAHAQETWLAPVHRGNVLCASGNQL